MSISVDRAADMLLQGALDELSDRTLLLGIAECIKLQLNVTRTLTPEPRGPDTAAAQAIAADFERAMEQNQFVIHYQPIVSLTTGRVLSFEALLRWQHPLHGLLSPDSFIQVAEETGLIDELSWWIIEEAARQTKAWQELFSLDPQLAISVNVTGRFFRDGIAKKLLDLIGKCGLAPNCLKLEITEHSFMDHKAAVLAELNSLKIAGVQLYIDDFGTGYSSLTYLLRYSYDTLKIDRSFIKEVPKPGYASAIVRAIVALGKDLNMNIVAEGVENAQQVKFLRDMNCPEAQGYWFSKPLPKNNAHQVLAVPLRLK